MVSQEASVDRLPVVVLDGKVPADLLDPRPWQVPDLLLEAEDYSPEARAYRDAAHQRAQWAAWALALNNEPMDLAQLRQLLDREALQGALEPHRGRDPRIADWLYSLEHHRGGIEDSGPNKRASEGLQTEPAFAIALFAGVDRPTVEQKSVSLDELRQLLNRFEVLDDKRRGRCWSPTRYADGATSRGKAGVAEVSALLFDLDKVPPDPERLAGVYWLGHTTWSHTPLAPRWRVVVPLTTPVPAARWSDVWRRARAALCPEADLACKDPSRAAESQRRRLGQNDVP